MPRCEQLFGISRLAEQLFGVSGFADRERCEAKKGLRPDAG